MTNLVIERRLIVHKDQKVIEDSGWQHARSWVQQWLKLVFALTGAETNVSVKDVGGVDRTMYKAASVYLHNLMDANAGVGVASRGIVVGTGSGVEANDDYKLGTQIADGEEADQLKYSSQGFTDPSIVAGNVDFLLTRNFENVSGAPITVEEIGVIVRGYDTGFVARYFLILRDLATQVVANLETLTVQYIIRTTV